MNNHIPATTKNIADKKSIVVDVDDEVVDMMTNLVNNKNKMYDRLIYMQATDSRERCVLDAMMWKSCIYKYMCVFLLNRYKF